MAPKTIALLVTETAAYAPLCEALSRPTISTSTFWSTAINDSDSDATTRSTTTRCRANREPSNAESGCTWSSRTAATQLEAHAPHQVPAGRGWLGPDHTRAAA